MRVNRKLCFFVTVLLFVIISPGMKSDSKAAIVNSGHQKYSYGELKSDLEEIEKKYGDYCQINVIGKSADARNLYEIVLGNADATKHLLVIGNLHAREYMTTTLCMKQIEYYLKNYENKISRKKVSTVLNEVAIHFIPSCNPDGTAISQFGFNAIKNSTLRKALRRMGGGSRRWKANARGVDLNRNWRVAFRRKGSPGGAGYHGKRAESEPETKALVRWVRRVEKQGKVVGVISYHSTGSILYGRCAGSATRYVKRQTYRMQKLARSMTGYSLMPTESIQQANSCSREYFLYRKHIPCITIEIGHGSCPLGAGEFPSIWRKNKNLVIREAMLFD